MRSASAAPWSPSVMPWGKGLRIERPAASGARGAAPAAGQGGGFPADVEGVRDTRVHAVAAGRRDLVAGVAREEHAAGAVAVGDEDVRPPDRVLEHLVDLDRHAADLVHERD